MTSPTGRLLDLQSHPSLAAALALFDDLDPVSIEAMLGSWRGTDVETGHRLDGLLESYGWWGKRFDGPEEAYPLVFEDAHGRFDVDPAGVPPALVLRSSPLLHQGQLAATARRLLRLRRTTRPKGRLRMVEHRGVVTGTLVYDALPVMDHFRKVDADTLLGVMDARGIDAPFVFLLRRAEPVASS